MWKNIYPNSLLPQMIGHKVGEYGNKKIRCNNNNSKRNEKRKNKNKGKK